MTNCMDCCGRGTVPVEKTLNGHTYMSSERCAKCKGSGSDLEYCPACEGKGGHVSYLECEVRYTYPEMQKRFNASEFDEVLRLSGAQYGAMFVHQEVRSTQDFMTFAGGDIREVAIGALNDFNSKHDGQHQKRLSERVVYGYAFLVLVKYQYEGQDYVMASHGDDKIWAPVSPLSKSSEEMIAEADAFLTIKDFDNAVKVIKHLEKSQERSAMLRSLVQSFQKSLITAYVDAATNASRYERAKLLATSQSLGNKEVTNSDRMVPLTQLFSFLVIPALAAFTYVWSRNKFSMESSVLQRVIVDSVLSSSILFAAVMTFFRTTVFKSHLTYPIIGFAIIAPSAIWSNSGSGWALLGAPIAALIAFAFCSRFALCEEEKTLEGLKPGELLETLVTRSQKEMDIISDSLPESYLKSKTDKESEQEARVLEDTVETSLLDERRNLLIPSKVVKAKVA